MRGEDARTQHLGYVADGSPPHARGRRLSHYGRFHAVGITPACAGKTSGRRRREWRRQDHPRMRGEDGFQAVPLCTQNGSPPHARGRHKYNKEVGEKIRITPACAGKTGPSPTGLHGRADHPRMRGEDLVPGVKRAATTGSPPHARGRRSGTRHGSGSSRITPACAGKTFYRHVPEK